jgi:predicted acetyltransferase
VEFVPLDERTRDTIMGIFEAWRLRQAGEIRRRDYRWDFDLGLREGAWEPRWKGFAAIHRDANGTADGYVLYKADEKWELGQPNATVTVNGFHALNDRAYAALWRFLAEMDWVGAVKAEGRRISERLPWLLSNARAAMASEIWDGMWVRVFDIQRALETRRYEQSGSLVLEVVDQEVADGPVRLALDAGPDGAQARATDRSADLTIDVRSLGAAYLGGTRLRDAVIADGADEHREGALAQLDTLLATRDEPWCSTFF